MFYFLITYGGTLAAIATAVVGALWGFAKWGGKTAVEQWLKRNYKDWELNREKPYKEDFKRFESKLDTIATRDEIKLKYAHPERANAAFEVLSKARSMERRLNRYMAADELSRQFPAPERNAKVDEMHKELVDRLSGFNVYLNDKAPLFDNEIVMKLRHLTGFVELGTAIETNDPPFDSRDAVQAAFADELKIIDNYVRTLLV